METTDPASANSPEQPLDLLEIPGAGVAAIGADGLFVSMPPGLATAGQRVVRSRSALDVVLPAERGAVITAWEQVRRTGYGTAQVHLVVEPDEDVDLHFLDLTASHGVYVMVLLPGSGSGKTLPLRDLGPVVPRLSRMRKDAIAMILEVDDAAVAMLGWTRDELIGNRSLDFIHPDDHVVAIDSWMQMLGTPGLEHRVRLRHGRKDGSWIWVEITNLNRLDDPVDPHVATEVLDVSEEMAMLEALRAREEMLQKLAEALPNGVLRFERDGRISYVNRRMGEIIGEREATTIGEYFALVAAEDLPRVRAAVDAVLDGEDVEMEVHLTAGARPGPRLCDVTLRPLTDAEGTVTGAIACVTDTTESAHMRAELERRATTDMLTGCSNRAVALQRLDEALGDVSQGAAVIFIDLDRFKMVNDQLGHGAGDELLKVIAKRLRHVARSTDCVGRVGGDEFVVVCPGVDTVIQARQIGERFVTAMRGFLTIGAQRIDPLASVGVAYAPRGRVTTADQLIAEADQAMYVSKRTGGGRPVLFSPEVVTEPAEWSGPTETMVERAPER